MDEHDIKHFLKSYVEISREIIRGCLADLSRGIHIKRPQMNVSEVFL
ncbi:hypothetical protein BSG1_15183 [Bacillus sp. SG-1]|nr:hypothetical protein BSG1_15183 [Bacillus sp. SG-1]